MWRKKSMYTRRRLLFNQKSWSDSSLPIQFSNEKKIIIVIVIIITKETTVGISYWFFNL